MCSIWSIATSILSILIHPTSQDLMIIAISNAITSWRGCLPWHLSVQKHNPELRQWQARLHQLDDAAKPSGEPGGSASGDLLWLIGGAFFSWGGGVKGGPPAPPP